MIQEKQAPLDYSKPLSIEEMAEAKKGANYCWRCDYTPNQECVEDDPQQLLFWHDNNYFPSKKAITEERNFFKSSYDSYSQYLKANSIFVVPKPAYCNPIPFKYFDEYLQ